ncbi:hypothetical protein BGX26_011811 [Mortierella sp. AD094]|nr:hypothetical protein BGX26_011811 [Mortierella sp. AD094]
MVMSIPYFCQKVLDDLSKSNMYNLLNRFSSSVWLLQYNDEAIMDILCLKDFNLDFFLVPMYTVPLIGNTGLIAWDLASSVVLSLRNDDRQSQLRQAQARYTYWKWVHTTLWAIDIASWFHQFSPSILPSITSNAFILWVFEEVRLERAALSTPGYIAEFGKSIFLTGIAGWALRTLIKDLKDELRNWWGGSVDCDDTKK